MNENLTHIKPLTVADIPVYGEVIRKSFDTVAKDFGWTRENAPRHTSFITNGHIDEIKSLIKARSEFWMEERI
jgi:hypothetical protein